MALPSYWLSMNRKDKAERAIVAKREQEALYKEKCESAARYHRDLNLKSSKYNTLEGLSSGISKVNEESGKYEEMKALKKEKLAQRRQKLALILAAENEQYLKELRERAKNEQEQDPWNLKKLKQQIEELQKQRKIEEEELRKRTQYHLYRCSDPYIAAEESLRKETTQAWEKHKSELEKQVSKVELESRKEVAALESVKQEAVSDIENIEKEKSSITEKWNEILQQQLDEVDKNNEESESLKQKIEQFIQDEELLNSVLNKWQDVKKREKERRCVIACGRQCKEKLRQMATEIRHGLVFDSNILDCLYQMGKKHEDSCSGIKIDVEDITQAINTFKKQIELEDKRVCEIQPLFHEEVTKMWSKRKEEWDREMDAHEKLMNEVFEKLKAQIQEKVTVAVNRQQNLLATRETLLEKISQNNEKAKKEEAEYDFKKEQLVDKVKNLNAQIGLKT